MPSKRPSLDHSERSSSDPRESANRLFGSAAVVDLLIVLCADPGRRYYVNELIKVTGRYPRSVQLGLARLEAAGVIRGERVANATFYCLVTDHPFAEALVAIAARIPRPVDLLKQALLGLDDVRVAFLRNADDDSGALDVIIVGRGDRPSVEAAVANLNRVAGREVSLEYFAEDEWRRQARRERSYVRWLLEEPRRYLIGQDLDLPS